MAIRLPAGAEPSYLEVRNCPRGPCPDGPAGGGEATSGRSRAAHLTNNSNAKHSNCRPAEEEGEFLQSCVKLNVGKRAGRLLGPGWVAPGGQVAAVLKHRRYGTASDRVVLRIYGATGRLEGSYPMGTGGEEFQVAWSATARFLAWVEVDGRGGQLRVIDLQRRRSVLSALSPLDEWPIFAPSGNKLLLPAGNRGEESVRELYIIDLLVKGSRQAAIRAAPDEELVQPRWVSPSSIQALRRKTGTTRGKTVQGTYQPADESHAGTPAADE